MTASWTALPWDSEFFGISIGRVDLDGLDAPAIARVEAEAAAAGVACLYGSLDPADAQLSCSVQRLGYRFVECATDFDLRPDEPPIPRPPGIDVRLGTPADFEALTEMVESLAPWSRYAVDPRFGLEASRRLQRAWAQRALADPAGAFQLVLAEDATGVIAFITRTIHPTPHLDGMGTSAPGSGAARYLVQDSRTWAGEHPLVLASVAARNIRALRWAGHCNFRVRQVRYRYHRWLDEEPGGLR